MSDTSSSNSPTNSVQVVSADPKAKTYNSAYVYASVLNVTLGSLFFGYVMSAFNPIQAFVQPHGFNKPVAKILITLMTSFVALGAAIGALTAGKIASKYGRRKPIMIMDFISIIGTVLTLLPNAISLLIGRLIQGYCVGANSSLVPLYINEIAPAEITGKLGTFNQLFIASGIIIVPLIGLGMPKGTGEEDPHSQFFRVILGIAGIFPLVRALLTFFVFKHETPKYLINTNNEAGARAILSKLYIAGRVDEELNVLKVQKEIQSRAGKITLLQIISAKYRRRLFVGVVVSMLQQLSGINAIIFFSNAIFSIGTKPGTILPTVYTVVLGAIQVFGVLVAGAVIERLGRKLMLISGMAFSAAVLGAFGILGILDPTSPAGKFLIWAYILGFGLSLGPLPWVYVSDILPDIGIGIAALANWISVFVIGLVFPSVADSGRQGMGWAFIFFAVCSLLGTIFMVFNLKETTGKSEAQISAMFGYKGDSTSASEPGRVENLEVAKPHIVVVVDKDDTESMKSSQTRADLERENIAHIPHIPVSRQMQIAVHS